MFGKRVTLFRLLGFSVRVDASWLILAALITWSLATGVFPYFFQGRDIPVFHYWLMGLAGMLGLLGSIVFHELCHSLVARRYGMRMNGITLFVFGGVAEMQDEPSGPKAECLMAAAGPLSSLVLAGILFGISLLLRAGAWPVQVSGVFSYLSLLNVILAVFNLLPAFPLDGGRILRSALWASMKDLFRATRIAAKIGSWLAFALMFAGVISLFRGNVLGGVWWFFIGIFLNQAAQTSYRSMLLRRSLQREKVRQLMRPDPVTVPPHLSLKEFMDRYVYRYHYRFYPVMNGEELLGCISTSQLRSIPPEEWERHTVGERATSCSAGVTIEADAPAAAALELMSRTHRSRLMVLDGGRLAGIISLKDMLHLLSLKLNLNAE